MDLAWITVNDLEKSKKFFTEVLGLKVSSGSDEHGWLELQGKDGGALLGVGQSRGGNQDQVNPGQNAIMTMTVDDIVQAKEMLETKGIKIVGDIIEVPGHVKMLMFTDLDGNKFQVVQMLG